VAEDVDQSGSIAAPGKGLSVRTFSAVIAAATLCAGLLAGPASAATTSSVTAPGDTIAGFLPEPAAQGMNDPGCRPSAAHPRPVVLVHGLGATASENWHFFAPYLAGHGYCVYGFTYGQNAMWPGRGGVQPMENSAAQLSTFVDDVLATTKASKVDIVGHSEGGIMPRYYLKFLGGAAKVAHFVAWAPPNHGTTINGLTQMRQFWPGFDDQMAGYCGSCPEFMPGSAFLQRLNAGGDTVGIVDYTVLATRYDWIVTPTETSYLKGPHTHNILIQDVNPNAYPEHVAMAWDPTTFELTLKALGG
jgi:triacylglycerol esterase/lipase EstA (alpha/beta hydrolase family)